MRVKYSKKLYYGYEGHNGFGICVGLEIIGESMKARKDGLVEPTPFIRIWPYNSKGILAPCMVEIPREDVAAVIRALIDETMKWDEARGGDAT